MPVKRKTTVEANQFRKDFAEYAAQVQKGQGPIVVTKDADVIGVFMTPAEYEELHADAVRRMFKERMKEKTRLTTDEVRARAKAAIRRAAKRA
jgi:prevent-host-death family protein